MDKCEKYSSLRVMKEAKYDRPLSAVTCLAAF